MIVLDTDILTLLAYGNEKVRTRISQVQVEEELTITVITYMEILQGRFDSLKKAANGDQLVSAMKRFIDSRRLLNTYRLLEVNRAAALHFTEMTKKKKGPKMKRGDMLIACIALAHDAVLVTRNVKDYQTVKGLRVENWVD